MSASLPLFHLVQAPAIKQAKNPVLLLLHGYGSNEEDLFSFAPQLPKEYYVISVRAPHQLEAFGFAWYEINFYADASKFSNTEQAIISRDLVVNFIDDLATTYPDIDSKNITLMGFSQGCILSYAIALSYPQKIKRVVAMSGYLNLDLLLPGFEKKNFTQLAIFASHGTQDQVIPVEWARQAKPFLEQLKINCQYKEYPVGHGVAPQNFYDILLFLKQTD